MEFDFSKLECALNGECSDEKVEECDVEIGSEYEDLVVKQNLYYIVAAVIFNENGEVLMVQEAKESCYGKWYLPAGKMEPNESIIDAVKREVMEEAGLEILPESLLCIEECGGRWIRFSLTGKVTGGKLKTTDEADEESLQAMWWNREDIIPIRCKDILSLIDRGNERRLKCMANRVTNLRPVLQSQKLLFLRTVIIFHGSDQHSILVRQSESSTNNYHLPTVRIHPNDVSFRTTVHKLSLNVFNTEEVGNLNTTITGVIGVEHIGDSCAGLDGVGFTVIVDLRQNNEGSLPECRSDFRWVLWSELTDNPAVIALKSRLENSKIDPLVPLLSLRHGRK